MPHVIIKIYPNRTYDEKRAMAESVAAALHATAGYDVRNVSVAVEEIEESQWMSQVYEPEIVGRQQQLVKRPEYGALAPDTY